MQAALEIAKRGGSVHLVCRNPKTAEEAKTEVEAVATRGAKVLVHILDLSESQAVCRFTRKFVQENDSLNCLVNNAGCMIQTREVSVIGISCPYSLLKACVCSCLLHSS